MVQRVLVQLLFVKIHIVSCCEICVKIMRTFVCRRGYVLYK